MPRILNVSPLEEQNRTTSSITMTGMAGPQDCWRHPDTFISGLSGMSTRCSMMLWRWSASGRKPRVSFIRGYEVAFLWWWSRSVLNPLMDAQRVCFCAKHRRSDRTGQERHPGSEACRSNLNRESRDYRWINRRRSWHGSWRNKILDLLFLSNLL